MLGFANPKLVKFDRELLLIEMSTVEPPFLVDFSQSRLDEPLEFDMDEWWERVEADFGDRFGTAGDVYFALQHAADIFYYDLAPRNLHFE